MRNNLLTAIYDEIFNETFDKNNFTNRKNMENAIYLLSELGIHVNNYGFDYYKFGPFSQVLLDDMCDTNDIKSIPVRFKDSTKKQLTSLSVLFNDDIGVASYSQENWVECLACIHFLKRKVLSYNASKEDVLAELKTRSAHLLNDEINSRAYDCIAELYH